MHHSNTYTLTYTHSFLMFTWSFHWISNVCPICFQSVGIFIKNKIKLLWKRENEQQQQQQNIKQTHSSSHDLLCFHFIFSFFLSLFEFIHFFSVVSRSFDHHHHSFWWSHKHFFPIRAFTNTWCVYMKWECARSLFEILFFFSYRLLTQF